MMPAMTCSDRSAPVKPPDQSSTVPQVELKGLSLRKNFSWTLIGNLVYAASQWGMLAILAKLASVAAVGQFTLGLAIAAPVFMLTNLQLRSIQATDARGDYDFQDYLGLRLLTSALGVVTVFAIGAAAGYPLKTAIIVMMIGGAKSVESVSDVIYGQLQQRERLDWMAQSLLIRGPLSMIVLAVLVATTDSIAWAVAGLVASWAAVLVVFDIPRCQRAGASLRPRWHVPTLRRLVWLALPLGIVMMLISLNTNIPRYQIEHVLGTYELGIFAAISYIMVAGNTVVSALGQSAAPRLSQLYALGDAKAFLRLLVKLVAVGMVLGGSGIIVVVAFGEPLLKLLYTTEYATYGNLLVALFVVAGFNYVVGFLGYAMTSMRYFKPQLPIFAVAAITTLAVGTWAIPIYGLYGAVLALGASTFIRGGGAAFVVAHALRSAPIRTDIGYPTNDDA